MMGISRLEKEIHRNGVDVNIRVWLMALLMPDGVVI